MIIDILKFLGTNEIVLGIASLLGIVGFGLTVFVSIRTAKISKTMPTIISQAVIVKVPPKKGNNPLIVIDCFKSIAQSSAKCKHNFYLKSNFINMNNYKNYNGLLFDKNHKHNLTLRI